VGGWFTSLGGTNRNHLGRLYPDGSLDANLTVNVDSSVFALAIQPDGEILLGGAFGRLNGQSHTGIGRLFPNGSLDDSFTANVTAGVLASVRVLAVQHDGKIIVAGPFGGINGEPRTGIARLNLDSSLDSAFNPAVNGTVQSVGVQSDGKILLAGNFTLLEGQLRPGIGRLNADGSLDAAFNPGTNGGAIYVALQEDNRILVVGNLRTTEGDVKTSLYRLHSDGSLDRTFNAPGVPLPTCVTELPDGRILVSTLTTNQTPPIPSQILRLRPDGAIDGGIFAEATDRVQSFAIQADAKIIIGGFFGAVNGVPCNANARLNPNGTLDESYISPPSVPSDSRCVVLHADGKIVLGGGGPPRGIARVGNNTAALQSIEVSQDGATVTWKRNGSSPEVQHVSVEQSANGTNFTLLGRPTRISGGWQLTGDPLPAGQLLYLRARGRTTGGRNGSSGLIESIAQFWRLPPPFISSVQVLGGGAFQFSFTNTNAVAFSVLASTNVAAPLASWENLGPPVPVGNGLYQFTDPGVTNHPRRIYQLRSP
jgi:uncharacterized delta-60 repeat protein